MTLSTVPNAPLPSFFKFEVNEKLSRGKRQTGGCGRLVAVDAEHIQRRERGLTLFEEYSYILEEFALTCFVAGQLDLKLEPTNPDYNVFPPLATGGYKPVEPMAHLVFRLAVITDSGSPRRGESQYHTPLLVEGNAECRPLLPLAPLDPNKTSQTCGSVPKE